MHVSTAVAPAADGEGQAALWRRGLLVLAGALVLERAVGLLANVLSIGKVCCALCCHRRVSPEEASRGQDRPRRRLRRRLSSPVPGFAVPLGGGDWGASDRCPEAARPIQMGGNCD